MKDLQEVIEYENYRVQKQTVRTINREYKTIFPLNINEAICQDLEPE